MRTWIPILLGAFALLPGTLTSSAREHATITGKVVDSAGKPLTNATVMVYSAGVKNGYSLFCPTCYRDCGKRTLTGPDGNYTIIGLDPELLFTLVAVKDEYIAAFVSNVDPAAGRAPNAILKLRPAVKDTSQIVRGRVVDTHGKPLRDTVIQPDFATFKSPGGQINFSGPGDWINDVTVTNDKGEFEVDFRQSALEMTLRVAARAMAPKHFTVPTGEERKTMIVTEGAMIRGRLLYRRKPVGGAEVVLVPHDAGIGRWYPEVRIGTTEDGTFAITNVPPGRIWLLRPTMESLASRGIGGDLISCVTMYDGQDVNLGDINLKPTHTLSGKIVLVDGRPIPPEMRLTITADHSGDSQMVKLGSDGRFQFNGLTDEIYAIAPAVIGYRLLNECGIACRSVEILVKQDVSDFVIKMEPESAPEN